MAESPEPEAAGKKPKRFVPAPPPPPPPNRRILLRLFLGALALTLTLGYLGFVLPDYMDASALPLNIGCWIILFLAWKTAFRIPMKLSRVTLALMIAVFPLLLAGQRNVARAELNLEKEIEARVILRLGTSRQGYYEEMYEKEKKVGTPNIGYTSEFIDEKEKNVLLKKIEERQPGWPRALGRLLPYVDVEVPDRGSHERYDRPYDFCSSLMGGPLRLTRLTVLQVSLRAEDRLLKSAEEDRRLFLPAWKKSREAEGHEEGG